MDAAATGGNPTTPAEVSMSAAHGVTLTRDCLHTTVPLPFSTAILVPTIYGKSGCGNRSWQAFRVVLLHGTVGITNSPLSR